MKKLLLFLVLLVGISTPVYGKTVTASIPTYSTYINGKLYDNTREKYPMVNYNGVTYVPLKYTLLRSMGLDTLWNQDTKNLFVYNSGDIVLYEPELTGKYTPGQKITLQTTDFGLYQNPIESEGSSPNFGKLDLENYEEGKFPLLFYKNLIYLPLTYNIFNLDFYFTHKDGFYIKSNNAVKGLLYIDGEDVYKIVGDRVYRRGYDENNYVKIGNIDFSSRTYNNLNLLVLYPDGELIRGYIPGLGLMQPESHFIIHRDRVEMVAPSNRDELISKMKEYENQKAKVKNILHEFDTNPTIIKDKTYFYDINTGKKGVWNW